MDSQARLTALMVEVMVVLTILVVNLLWREIVNVVCIPHNCHFLENKIYTEKRVNYDKLHSKLPILRVNYDKLHRKLPIFCVKSVKIYTVQFLLHRHRLWCL